MVINGGIKLKQYKFYNFYNIYMMDLIINKAGSKNIGNKELVAESIPANTPYDALKIFFAESKDDPINFPETKLTDDGELEIIDYYTEEVK